QPAVRRVVDGQARLHAGQPFAAGGKGVQGETKLVGLRLILRVIDRDERAACELQSRVERFRLGARAAARRYDGLEGSSEPQRCNRLAGLVVVGLDYEFDVELLQRIVQSAQRGDQALDRCRLAIERDDDGVGRK